MRPNERKLKVRGRSNQPEVGSIAPCRVKIHNMQLVGGAAFLVFTMACGQYLNAFVWGQTPWDIVYKTRGTCDMDGNMLDDAKK